MQTKDFWRKGSGEVMGFLFVLPVILTLFLILVSIVQLGSIKEKMEYATYAACRAAVTSKDFDSAQNAAYSAAEADLLNYSETFFPNTLEVKLTVINGETSKPVLTDREARDSWKKGSYATCTITIKVKTLINMFQGKRTSSLTMMIESPVSGYEEIFN